MYSTTKNTFDKRGLIIYRLNSGFLCGGRSLLRLNGSLFCVNGSLLRVNRLLLKCEYDSFVWEYASFVSE